MSNPIGQYGSQGYESPEARTLGKFASDKFSYREQAKNIIELNNAVGYMSAYMRKMQRGIDQANQNALQQIQSLINDFLVLIGGGGDTGFDFGDLKYVVQAIGALFGFADENGNITLPINLFHAAWYFFSEYIAPVDNFRQLIDEIVDSLIATVLDIFGEVPILGQALEQLAVIISDIRDLLDPVADSLDSFLGVFDITIGDTAGIANIFGAFKPIWEALSVALDGVTLPDFSAMFHIIAQWTIPFVTLIVDVINAMGPLLTEVVDLGVSGLSTVIELISPVIQALAPILQLIVDVVNGLWPILDQITLLINAFGYLLGLVPDPDGTIQNFWADISQPLADLLSSFLSIDPAQFQTMIDNSVINAQNIIGTILPANLGQISISTIGDNINNLLVNPFFENLDSFLSAVGFTATTPADWGWASDEAHSAVGGSMVVTADGTGSKDLLSNTIGVSKDQVINMSVWVKYTNMVGTGSPIQLAMTAYLGGNAVDQPVIASVSLSPPSSDWRQLSGTYTVPANVDAVRMRLSLQPTATSGTVMFSDASLTKSGMMPQRLVTDLVPNLQTLTSNIANAFTQLINKVETSDFANLLNTLGGNLTQIDARMKSFLNGSSPLNASNILSGAIADQFLPGVETTVDNIVTRLFGISGSGFQHTDAQNALAHISDTLAGMGAQVNQLVALQTSGVTAQDDFERFGSNLGGNWQASYPTGSQGYMYCDGHNAAWSKGIGGSRLFWCQYMPLTTYGDFQIWRITLDNQADNPILQGITGQPAYNDVLGRMSKDNLNFVRFRMGAGQAWIQRVVNGIPGDIVNPVNYSGSDPGPGSMLTLVCGWNGNARYFQGRHNNNIIIEGAETGVASMLGGAYRGGGFGGLANPWLATQSAPGRIRQWTGGDQ